MELCTFDGHNGDVSAVSFSPDGQYVLTGSEDRSAKLWRKDGSEVRTFGGHSGWITTVDFSPDGQYILTGSWDSTVKLWSLSGIELCTFSKHSDIVLAASFSSNGQYILTGSLDNTARLYRTKDIFLENHVQKFSTLELTEFGLDIGNKKFQSLLPTATDEELLRLYPIAQRDNFDFPIQHLLRIETPAVLEELMAIFVEEGKMEEVEQLRQRLAEIKK